MNIQLHDPRPDDTAELAKMTAIELRKRGIWAEARPAACRVIWFIFIGRLGHKGAGVTREFGCHSPTHSMFADLGPIAIADVIQAEESRMAQEWAGDVVDAEHLDKQF